MISVLTLRRKGRRGVRSRSEKPEEEEPLEEWELLEIADRSSPEVGIGILKDIYLKYPWNTTAAGRAVANDPEALRFLASYWRYLQWNEHGNEAALSEVEFEGVADIILRPAYS
jgi:hypothetical protein